MNAKAESGGGVTRCLLVRCGGLLCALPIARVRRVVRALAVHPLPGAAPELLGLAEYGGEPLPVLDLARLLAAPPDATPARPVTVVVVAGPEGTTELAGMAADAALDVVDIPAGGLVAGSGTLVAGEALVGGRPVSVLDLASVGAGG